MLNCAPLLLLVALLANALGSSESRNYPQEFKQFQQRQPTPTLQAGPPAANFYHQQLPTSTVLQHQQARHNHRSPIIMGPSSSVPAPTQVSQVRQPAQFSVCQLENSKCLLEREASFNRSALADFQKILHHTSSDLRTLIETYADEFKSLSLDLILLAKNNTLLKIPNISDSFYQAIDRLFDSMHSHLQDTHESGSGSQNFNHFAPQHNSHFSAQGANLNTEISNYFYRLNLILLKRLLEAAPTAETTTFGQVDLECLGSNLKSQQQIEKVISELTSDMSQQDSQIFQTNMQQLSSEQIKLTQSIKQSLEFTKTLLSSLTLANEMFYNLTQEAGQWMPHSSCHQALAKMTICPQCYSQPNSSNLKRISRLTSDFNAPPCESYCLNVVRGCMNDIYELHRFWVDHVDSLAKFRINMIQMNNIENVMSNLDEKLINFTTKLIQQYNITLNNNSPNSNNDQRQSAALEMRKLCFREPAAASAMRGRFHRLGALNRPAAKMLPPTQSIGGQRYGQVALRARLSPAFSLFNRLEEFVSQLELSRNFFIEWPERLCHRIRQDAIRLPAASHQPAAMTKNGSLEQTGACWNGRDFNGYNKKVEPFGQALSVNHPEVPLARADPYNTMVLEFVAKLKDVGGQLSRIAKRSSSQLYQQALDFGSLASLVSRSAGGGPEVSSPGGLISGDSGAIRPQARVSEPGASMEMISAAAAAAAAHMEEEDSSAASQTEELALVPSDNTAAELEDPPAGRDEPETDEEEEDEEADKSEAGKKCTHSDCIDLFAITDVANSNNMDATTSADNSQLTSVKLPPNQQLEPDNSGHLPTVVILNPRVTSHQKPFSPLPADNNNQQQTDYIESYYTPPYANGGAGGPNPAQGASGSSSLFDIYNFGSMVLIVILFMIIMSARRAFKRQQIIVV